MTLMKSRSALLVTDLSQNFTISGYLHTQSFYSWRKGMGEYFKSIVYISVNDQNTCQQLHWKDKPNSKNALLRDIHWNLLKMQ